jgi:hypothetical protein
MNSKTTPKLDRWMDPETGAIFYTQAFSCFIPCRLVLWPEGAPPRKDVLHAGTKVKVRGRDGVHTVVSGIPYEIHGDWYIHVANATGYTVSRMLSEITPIPDEPETETEPVVSDAMVDAAVLAARRLDPALDAEDWYRSVLAAALRATR